jgi:hypothetical protein
MHWSHISTVVFSSIALISFVIFQVFRSMLAKVAVQTNPNAKLVQSYELVIEVFLNWVMPLSFVFAAFSAGVPTVQD